MGWSLGFIENGTEEVADAARFFYILNCYTNHIITDCVT